ncbi:MAG: hypothetical protein IH787_00940 [Nitrospirae bacterium]|nr:hypothetical protein [Nitrospirota bacterium]
MKNRILHPLHDATGTHLLSLEGLTLRQAWLDIEARRIEAELAARMPTRPWSDLEGAALPELLRRFDGKAQHVTTAGLVVDGVLYARPCPTDFGDYPYCAEMRHGVYAMTKSMGAALSLLRLAQKYGDEVFGLRIADYLDVTADHDGWDKVTFADALNMATGIGDKAPNRVSVSYDFEADDDQFSLWLAPELGILLAKNFVVYAKPGWGIINDAQTDRDFTFEIGFRYFMGD